MKTRTICFFLILSLLLASCSILSNTSVRIINPSKVNTSENRQVSGFTSVDFSTQGKVNLIQSDQESVNISGPDNVVPEIITTVTNGTLSIRMKDNLTINPLGSDNPLTFTIAFKSLTSLKVSGVGDVQIETFSTPSMKFDLSGAGHITQYQLTTDNLTINLSGVGALTFQARQLKPRSHFLGLEM